MDAHDILELERRMTQAAEELHRNCSAVAMSRQVLEFVSDQRKNTLAKYAAPLLKAGESAAAADTLARSESGYLSEFKDLQEQVTKAYGHIAKWDALHCKFEAARSALSLARTQIQL